MRLGVESEARHKDECDYAVDEALIPNARRASLLAKANSSSVSPLPPPPDVHDIDVVWFPCDYNGCPYRAKRADSLNRHKQFKHSLGVKWFYCPTLGCSYKAKQQCNVERHKKDAHNVNVQWNYCGEKGCEYKAKQAGNVKKHRQLVHGIVVERRKEKFFFCNQPGEIGGWGGGWGEECTISRTHGTNSLTHSSRPSTNP